MTGDFTAKLTAMEGRAIAEAKRANAAEADTAKLLAAIERARARPVAVVPPVVATNAAEPASPIPADAAYLILPGDTAARVAAKNGLTPEQIRSLNPTVNWARLRVGEQVRIK